MLSCGRPRFQFGLKVNKGGGRKLSCTVSNNSRIKVQMIQESLIVSYVNV